ncbi:hypothetical protein FH972_007630 [Carpinus fangiana]|uniref:Vesicle transport v-SNARE N-terminal domain-containing protein n=1 Tax=Carpinus fangiana TaxID=176857 RepID=A0A5N6QW95_9ROSI|nr:hypothetical protein FH972_007630 [Carpinus fangiana]
MVEGFRPEHFDGKSKSDNCLYNQSVRDRRQHPSELKLHGVEDNIKMSQKVLTAMSRRMSRKKWIIGTIVAALVIAVVFLILYFKLSKE